MDSNCSEYKGSFEPHKINKNDNYAGSLEMRNINTSNPEIVGSGSLGKLVNTNMSIEDYWKKITYTQGDKCPEDPNCKGEHGTCVLASFAIAAYPFVKKDVLKYFDAYCEYYFTNLPSCSQYKYEIHFNGYVNFFKKFESVEGLGGGYGVIWQLYHESQNEIFQACRDAFSLDKIGNQNTIEHKINSLERKLSSGSTAMIFLNKPCGDILGKWQLPGMHSIAIAYSEVNRFFFRDPNCVEIRKNIESISNIHNFGADIGDCLILTEKTS